LNDLRGLRRLTGIGALSSDAMSRDGDSAVQLVQLVAFNADSFLAAPAQTLRPSQIPYGDAFDAVGYNLDLLILARRAWNAHRRVAQLHT
jgi:hypothetical protein